MFNKFKKNNKKEMFSICKSDHKTIELMQWLKNNNFRNVTKLQICQFSYLGYGIISRTGLKSDSILISIPLNLTINYQTVQKSTIAINLFQNCNFLIDEWLMIFLIYEKYLSNKSYWFPYINSLPETVLELFQIEHKVFIEKLFEIKQKFDKITKNCPISLKDIFTVRNLQWAYTIVNTRSVYFDWTKLADTKFYQCIDEPKMCLVPFLDMFNHSNKTSIEYKMDKNNIMLLTRHNLVKNRQIFITYGNFNNKKLMLEYGFVLLPFNSLDTVELELKDLLNLNQTDKVVYEFIKGHNFDKNLYIDQNGPSFSARAIMIIAANKDKTIKELSSIIFGSNELVIDFNHEINRICCKKLNNFQENNNENYCPLLKSYEKSQINYLKMLLNIF